jgi:arylsulfatase
MIQHIEDMGKLDNTLIIYIAGDNGNSAEGSLVGTPNEVLRSKVSTFQLRIR